MDDLYIKRTNHVKADCTPAILYGDNSPVHDVYMAGSKEKKVVPRLKKPKFQPTFIKKWRTYRGLTQEQLAERVSEYLAERGVKKGYTHASIGRLENGLIGYSQIVLEALADRLGTDCASLLMRDPTDGRSMWTLWERAQPAERSEIEDIAEIVLKKARKTG